MLPPKPLNVNTNFLTTLLITYKMNIDLSHVLKCVGKCIIKVHLFFVCLSANLPAPPDFFKWLADFSVRKQGYRALFVLHRSVAASAKHLSESILKMI